MTLVAAPLLVSSGVMPTIALVFFLGLFVAIVGYVFVIPKSVWQKDAELPLDREETTK